MLSLLVFCGLVPSLATSESLFFEKESAEDPLESQAETRHLQSWRCLPCLENFFRVFGIGKGYDP